MRDRKSRRALDSKRESATSLPGSDDDVHIQKQPQTQPFDLAVVLEGFKACPREDGTHDLTQYLYAFRELTRFFKLMGRVFGFVALDLQSRIKTLESHQNGNHSSNYKTAETMVDFELNKGIAKKYSSGTSNLVELQRVLEFIVIFMDRTRLSEDNAKTSVIAAEIYPKTMGRFHAWPIRKLAGIAMMTLPLRRDLIETMCKHDTSVVEGLLKDIVTVVTPQHEAINEYLINKKVINE